MLEWIETLFGLRSRRRQRLLSEPFPAAWRACLEANVPHYGFLGDPDRAKLRDGLRILIAEKNWEGCGGLTLNDEIRVTIAAQAALLVIGFSDFHYDRLQTILVYPRAFVVPERVHSGLLVSEQVTLAGEAWQSGCVVVSWDDAFAGGRDPTDGHNLIFHEFAHQLDTADHAADGIPPLGTDDQHRTWLSVLNAEFDALVEQAGRGAQTLLDDYGATNKAEFFAVATECFFERPIGMEEQHGRLYAILRDFFRQDPARWPNRSGAETAAGPAG